MLRTGLLALCLGAAARAEVHVLDAAGGGDFTTLQQVMDGTVDGDFVLVRPGNYVGGTALGNKALTLAADGTGPVDFPGLRIAGVPAGKVFVLRGLRFVNPSGLVADMWRVSVEGSEGLVLIEDCEIVAPSFEVFGLPTVGLQVIDADAALSSCQLIGTPGKDDSVISSGGTKGHFAMRTLAARVSLSNCTLSGGAGGNELAGVAGQGAGAGGVALQVVESQVVMDGCLLSGGDGGVDTGVPMAGGAAAGGVALTADADSIVWLRDTLLEGGDGGTDASGLPGLPGADTTATNVVSFLGPARTLHLEAPLGEGLTGLLEAHGEPFEAAFALVSSGAAFAPVPKLGGVLQAAPALTLLPLGTLDANGQLHAALGMPHLGLSPGAEVHALLQLVTTSASGAALGNATLAVVLPPGS